MINESSKRYGKPLQCQMILVINCNKLAHPASLKNVVITLKNLKFVLFYNSIFYEFLFLVGVDILRIWGGGGEADICPWPPPEFIIAQGRIDHGLQTPNRD